MNPTSARTIAFEVLTRVQTSASYSNVLLNALLTKNPGLPPPERRLATELVFGVLRNQTLLDHYLARAGLFRADRTDAPTTTTLRLGAYQIMFLSRTPDFAAVSQTVQIAKQHCGRKASGFVNALLRRLVRCKSSIESPQVAFEADEAEFIRSVALVFSFPEQLISRWSSRLRRKELVEMVSALNRAPSAAIRVNLTKTTPDHLTERLNRRGFRVEEPLVCPYALRLSRGGAAESTPEWDEGLFTIQDEGAQALGLLLDGMGPESIVDVCAGIGQKLTHLAELFPHAFILGNDIYAKKIKDSRQQAMRLGLKDIRLIVSDVRCLPLSGRSFDLVLLDAPCSGTGAIRRRPEIRWRVGPVNLAKLARLQLKMLESCKNVVRAGGTVVYSTCSLEPEENERVISKFLKRNGDFRVQPMPKLPEALGRLRGKLGITLFPHIHDSDGMFFSLLARRP